MCPQVRVREKGKIRRGLFLAWTLPDSEREGESERGGGGATDRAGKGKEAHNITFSAGEGGKMLCKEDKGGKLGRHL